MKDNLDFILFAVEQAKEAQAFGFPRNLCCRNLKTALIHYWQHKTLGMGQKARISRSKAARNKPLNECIEEHVVPLMVIVNRLMDMKSLTKPAVNRLLKKWYHVRLVTNAEHKTLTKLKLRYTMTPLTPRWKGTDIFARYTAAGITVAPPR